MKNIKNILRGSDNHVYLIMSDGTTERTDAARLEPIAAGTDWNEINSHFYMIKNPKYKSNFFKPNF